MSVYKGKSNKATRHVQTVAVALSGGVDSSVAAALLKKQGYKVVGFFMKNWSERFGLKESDCPWYQDRQDAMVVSAKLDIPFHTLDFQDEYKNQVLDYFFREYQAGRTPNPDVMCNATIKFGVFLDKALELGADFIATGHYARLDPPHPSSPLSKGREQRFSPRTSGGVRGGSRGGQCQLLTAKDTNKDQTYFLYRLTQSQLSKTIFPIGDYTKPEVRKLAKKFGLPNHDKRDSQGVCFIGHIDLRKFLSQKIKEKPGDIVLVGAENFLPKVVGKHQGLFWYTIGQRQGINIGGIGPFYVVEKDLANNQLIVGNNPRDERLYKTVVEFGDVNWIGGQPPFNPPLGRGGEYRCMGRIRYREPLVKCAVERINRDKYRATFEKPMWAVAAGQSVVFYEGEVCLGGGIIS